MTLYDTIFEQLEEGSFDGIVIPVQGVKITTGSALAFHRYPGRPGADIEPLGREPISGVIVATFVNDLEDVGATNDLWPGALQLLRERAQEQKPGPLVLPTLGRLPSAYIKLDEDYTPDLVDGARVQIQFFEDSSAQFAGLKLTSVRSRLISAAADADLALDVRAADALRGVTSDDGASFTSFTNAIYNIIGQIDAAMDDIARPLRQLAGLVQAIDAALNEMRFIATPDDWPTADALRELKYQAQQTASAISKRDEIVAYVCALPTNIVTVARDTKNTIEELLGLNIFEDANNISAGTVVTVLSR